MIHVPEVIQAATSDWFTALQGIIEILCLKKPNHCYRRVQRRRKRRHPIREAARRPDARGHIQLKTTKLSCADSWLFPYRHHASGRFLKPSWDRGGPTSSNRPSNGLLEVSYEQLTKLLATKELAHPEKMPLPMSLRGTDSQGALRLRKHRQH